MQQKYTTCKMLKGGQEVCKHSLSGNMGKGKKGNKESTLCENGFDDPKCKLQQDPLS